MENTFLTKHTDYWLDLLEQAGVPAAPIYNLDQAFSDPQAQARDMLVETESPNIGRMKNIGIPVKLSVTPGAIRSMAPALGQHTKEILEASGYTNKEIIKLEKQGIIGLKKG